MWLPHLEQRLSTKREPKGNMEMLKIVLRLLSESIVTLELMSDLFIGGEGQSTNE